MARFDGNLKAAGEAKLDIDEAPGVASTYGIMAVPTLILFKGGREQRRMTGFKPKPELENAIKSAL